MTEAELYPNDLCTEAGARRLKTRIEAYWARQGYRVKVTVTEAEFNPAMRSTRFDLRSDLVNGLPRVRV